MTEPWTSEQIALLRSLPRSNDELSAAERDHIDAWLRSGVVADNFVWLGSNLQWHRSEIANRLVATIDALRGQVLSEVDEAAEKLVAADQAAEILIHHDKPNWVCGQDGATGRHVHVTRDDDEVFTADTLTDALFAATRTPAEAEAGAEAMEEPCPNCLNELGATCDQCKTGSLDSTSKGATEMSDRIEGEFHYAQMATADVQGNEYADVFIIRRKDDDEMADSMERQFVEGDLEMLDEQARHHREQGRLEERASLDAVLVARCPIHGLHGERDECFVCGGPVEQVPMVPLRGGSNV